MVLKEIFLRTVGAVMVLLCRCFVLHGFCAAWFLFCIAAERCGTVLWCFVGCCLRLVLSVSCVVRVATKENFFWGQVNVQSSVGRSKLRQSCAEAVL